MSIYDIIKSQLPKELKHLTIEEKRTLIDNISKLDNEGQQLIFILINSFNKENNIEYQGNTIESGEKTINIKFNLDLIDNKLQHIIYRFSNIHYNKMLDDLNRIKIQKI